MTERRLRRCLIAGAALITSCGGASEQTSPSTSLAPLTALETTTTATLTPTEQSIQTLVRAYDYEIALPTNPDEPANTIVEILADTTQEGEEYSKMVVVPEVKESTDTTCGASFYTTLTREPERTTLFISAGSAGMVVDLVVPEPTGPTAHLDVDTGVSNDQTIVVPTIGATEGMFTSTADDMIEIAEVGCEQLERAG